MGKFIDETGKRYGRLMVIERVRNIGTSAAWHCQCDCGNKVIVRGGSLRRGSTQSCKCLRREKHSERFTKDEVDNRYGKLTVIRRDCNIAGRGTYWLCQCNCGNTIVVRGIDLRGGHTKSCGCLRKLPEGESSFNRLLRTYKRNAKEYNRAWHLTREQFRELTKQPCHYCGTEPARIFQPLRSNGPYICNGIDRIDNGKGYEIDNVVSCCEICNRAKRAMPVQEFEEWLDRICLHHSPLLYEKLIRQLVEE